MTWGEPKGKQQNRTCPISQHQQWPPPSNPPIMGSLLISSLLISSHLSQLCTPSNLRLLYCLFSLPLLFIIFLFPPHLPRRLRGPKRNLPFLFLFLFLFLFFILLPLIPSSLYPNQILNPFPFFCSFQPFFMPHLHTSTSLRFLPINWDNPTPPMPNASHSLPIHIIISHCISLNKQ